MPSCFVIGPIGERDSDVRAHADDLIKYIIAPVVTKLGYGDPERADKMPEPGRITTQVIRHLKEADLVIADLTGGNPNVYYELSLRHVLRLPLIHMAADGTRLPFDVVDGRTIFFHMHSRRAETAREELSKQVEHINGGAFKASNPITEALDIISLEGSAQPVERALASIMGKLDTLNGAAVATMQAMARRPFQFVPPFIHRAADVTLFSANEPTILSSVLGTQTSTVLDDEEPKEPR